MPSLRELSRYYLDKVLTVAVVVACIFVVTWGIVQAIDKTIEQEAAQRREGEPVYVEK